MPLGSPKVWLIWVLYGQNKQNCWLENWNWSGITWVLLLLELLQFSTGQELSSAPPTHCILAGKCSHSIIFRFGAAVGVYVLCSKHRWTGKDCFCLSTPCLEKCCFGSKQSQPRCTNGLVNPVLGWRCLHWNGRGGRWMGSSKDSSQTPRSTGADWSCE